MSLVLLPGVARAEGKSVYRVGDKGEVVVQIQKALKKKGFYKYDEVTGYYGKITEKAVTEFQKRNKLWTDGIAGPVTLKALLGSSYKVSSGSDKDYSPDSLREGCESSEVEKLQKRLKSLGYYTYSRITGYYGPITEKAVRAFQKANGLTVDGIAGKKTLKKVYSSSAVKAGKNSSKSSTSSRGDETSRGSSDSSASSTASSIIAYAKKFLGKPYVYGASGPSSFDCTGFTCYVYRHFGISLPRSAKEQGYKNYGTKLTRSQLKPGDLVFFDTIKDSDSSDHAGIYIGDGKFIHCSSTKSLGKKVCISSLDSGFYKKVFSWGRRVLK